MATVRINRPRTQDQWDLLVARQKPRAPVVLRQDRPMPAWAWYNVAPHAMCVDIVSGDTYPIVGSSITPGEEYWTFSGDNNADRINLGAIPPAHPLSLYGRDTSFTLIADVDWDGAFPSLFPRIIEKSNSGSSAGGWGLYISDATPDEIVFQINSATGAKILDFVPGRLQIFVRGDSAGKTIYMVRNGVVIATGTTVTTTFPATTTNAAIGNWNHSTDRNWSGKIYGIALYHEALPLDLAARIASNMWAESLEPANDAPFLYVVPSSGAAYDETYSASATADLVLTDSWALDYAESFQASAASSLALTDAWALGYAETFVASAAATLTLTDTYESPSVAYDETYAASAAGALSLTESWALDYAETLTASAAADLALTDTWALDYAETYAAVATGDLTLTHAYAVGNHYAETYAATAISALTLTDAYSAQYSETYATTANSALTLSEAWALGYAETYEAVGITGLALTDVYDTPAPGVFDETYAASAVADLDLTHLFYTPAAIPQVTNPTLQATGTARTLQTSGTVRTLRGRQTIH